MERELAYLREREDGSRHHQPDTGSCDRYDNYRRGNSPGHPPRDSNYMSRKEPTYDSGRGDGRGRGYYNRPDPGPRAPGGGGDSYRENISYPMQGGANRYDRRDEPPSQYRGSGGYNRSGPMPAPNVGYGGGGSQANKSSGPGAPPPGWPSSAYDKSNVNRAPFTNSAPWN